MVINWTHQLSPTWLIFLIITASILLNRLSELKICAGNPEPKFISIGRTKKNSQFLSPDSEVMAFLDNNACVSANGLEYPITVRCSKCHLLTDEVRCPVCTKYRKNLVAQEAHITKQTCMLQKSSKTNYRSVHLIFTGCHC